MGFFWDTKFHVESCCSDSPTPSSSPLWASIVSILNSHSIKITGKTLGFLNPLLYQMAKECPNCLKDITVGNNKCTSTICTNQCKGFQAACGWDPVTGLGSPNIGNILKYITKLLEKNKTTITQRKIYLNFTELTSDLREYFSNPSANLTEKLFPWIYYSPNNRTVNDFKGEKNSKGIVICTGNEHFGVALVAIKALEIIENELPIEVIYSTSSDLSQENQDILRKNYPNIRLIDLSTMSFNDNYLKLRGWEIKSYAVLASQFEQVLLIDADVLFFEKPSILFQHELYIQTGSLFFHDRPIITKGHIHWIESFSIQSNRTYPQRTQESGVVLIDKSRLFFGLLAICKLNDYHERHRITYEHLYGDKDTWWIGLHMMNLSYSFVPTMTAGIGQIGKKKKQTIICGHLLHYDEQKTLLWWNGGILKNRSQNKRDLLNIEAWNVEGQWRIGIYSCLSNNEQQPRKFTSRQQQLLNSYHRITTEVFHI
ncbi:unnamed protein product [Adineta ricciae]|uniref:Peptidase S53 domain-containing protein n=1 Tax=Adineta ricciae TaxID=249248 RepID=A0A814ZQF0_ADIRI|nr:unnamed protein product [Adineta ricciae]